MLAHTPIACQSRSRRQHVIPEPQPISCGSISHGTPLLRTKIMPVRAARSAIRGRPPFGCGGGAGIAGAIAAHVNHAIPGRMKRRRPVKSPAAPAALRPRGERTRARCRGGRFGMRRRRQSYEESECSQDLFHMIGSRYVCVNITDSILQARSEPRRR